MTTLPKDAVLELTPSEQKRFSVSADGESILVCRDEAFDAEIAYLKQKVMAHRHQHHRRRYHHLLAG